MKIVIPRQHSDLFLSLMNDAKTAQAAYAAGWDAALTSLAKRLGAVEKEQTQDDQRQRTEELPGIPADTATSGG